MPRNFVWLRGILLRPANWTDIRCVDRTPPARREPLYAVIALSRGTSFSGSDD